MTAYRKKLIEVALPLDAINRESAREKSIRHGHPSTLHLWWARRPLAACRAVIFSSLVDDPDEPKAPKKYLEALDKLEKPPTGADGRRERLFYFIERLVKWESTTDEKILGTARELIRLSCDGNPPPVLDPFCGGGSIPLEAQRLGLEAYASDLNPVAVLITKALVEIPPKFTGRPPVNPDDRAKLGAGAAWKGAAGLAADVRHYGKWMRDRAWERIGHLYPKGPNGETVIAWLWARTVKCPNPACGAQMPLARSFRLSTQSATGAWVEPVIDSATKTVVFSIASEPGATDGTVTRTGATCVVCEVPVGFEHVRQEGAAGRMGAALMAMIGDGRTHSRNLPATQEQQVTALSAAPGWQPETDLPEKALGFRVQRYGMTHHSDLFSSRQLAALSTFADLIQEARTAALEDSDADGAYADAVATYLAFAVSKSADYWSTLSTWAGNFIRGTFARQALAMVWDYAEANPFSDASGNWMNSVEWVSAALVKLPYSSREGHVTQLDAASSIDGVSGTLIATDPPYYDNIGYADLSDYFYTWLRRSLASIYPELFATVLTPKTQELIATPFRFNGSRKNADEHFEHGLRRAFALMQSRASSEFPITLYYAFKQAEQSAGNGSSETLVSTGWQAMLGGLADEHLEVRGTWPMRTERGKRMVSMDTNALASSIVLVCRPRSHSASSATFKQFQNEVARELPDALAVMTGRDREDVAQPWVDPIDLRQAAIGPGMAVYSRYSRVQKAAGDALSVREALIEINEAVDHYFDEMEGALDKVSRFCLHWYRENGFSSGQYGRAEILAKATDTDPERIERAGLLISDRGKVRLFKRAEYLSQMLTGPSIWEVCHRLVRALGGDGGEERAARLYNQMPGLAEEARDLAYRLYLEAEKKGRAEDALGYNALVASWTDIRSRANTLKQETQGALGV